MIEIARGEWWLDSGGHATFADGDVGDVNHEMTAFYAALGLDEESTTLQLSFKDALAAGVDPEDYGGEDEFPIDVGVEPGPLGLAEAAALLVFGSDPHAVKWFATDKQADARVYAIQHMGWIRVKSHGQSMEIEVWEFDDDALKRIRNAEELFEGDDWEDWPEGWPDCGDHPEANIEEVKTGKYRSVPLKVLFKAPDATAIKAYCDRGARSSWALDGVRSQRRGGR